MLIDKDKCIGCGSCLAYCPMNAIVMDDASARIEPDECVECGVCRRVAVCPVDAIEQQPLSWPRGVRAIYSDPLNIHQETGLAGRGTEEIKTNDVTGRFKRGFAGIALEIGRPGIGARLRDLEKLSMALARYGVEFEPKNPLSKLINPVTGELPPEIRNEKVLSAIIEFAVPESELIAVLDVIRTTGGTLDTVFCVDVACRAGAKELWPTLEVLRKAGTFVRPNAKINVGLGRPFVE